MGADVLIADESWLPVQMLILTAFTSLVYTSAIRIASGYSRLALRNVKIHDWAYTGLGFELQTGPTQGGAYPQLDFKQLGLI